MNDKDINNSLLDLGIDIQKQQDTVDKNLMQLPNNKNGFVVNSNDQIPAIHARITLPAINQPHNSRGRGLKTPIRDVLRIECNVHKQLSRFLISYFLRLS
jgi:hypothetical protein